MPERTAWWRALWALFLLLTAALAGGAVYAWRLRCEGFGCVGVGIVWFIWAVAAGAHGLLGLTLLLRTRKGNAAWRRPLQSILVVQAGLMLALAGYWLLH